MEETDATLIRRSQKGDKEAFGVLVKRYAGPARGAAYLLLRNYDDALDASQEAFVLAWRHIRRFDLNARFYPWYSRILHNVCISRLRRKKRRAEVEYIDSSARPNDSDPVLQAERNERKDRVWRAILQLPDHHREVIVMWHFQGMAYKDIAAALDIPIGTVMSRLYNARAALRKLLKDESR